MPMTSVQVRQTLSKRNTERKREQRARPVVKLYDKDWELYCVLWGEIEAKFETKLNDTGEGTLKLFGKHKVRDWLLKEIGEAEDVHITVETPGVRWAGKANTIKYSNPSGGFDYIEINFLHDYEHVKKITCYSNPLLPAEFQWPKQFLWAGPSVSGIRLLTFLNLLRRFAPLWALPENVFSPSSWLGNLNPNNWPIIMAPDAGFLSDTSMWTVITTRFGNLHDVVTPTLKDAGLQIECTRWLPGDKQPFPTHAFLTKPTLILDVVDKSGVRGPTGTVFDGLLSLGQHILNDGITEVIDVLDIGPPPDQYGTPGFFGTVTEWPWVSFRNGMRTGQSGISSWEMTVHKALAGTVVTGGKSPSWVCPPALTRWGTGPRASASTLDSSFYSISSSATSVHCSATPDSRSASSTAKSKTSSWRSTGCHIPSGRHRWAADSTANTGRTRAAPGSLSARCRPSASACGRPAHTHRSNSSWSTVPRTGSGVTSS